ncbi:glycosyltransferase [Anaerobacillus alkaliphilus]|uniref:Glycosyltransferase n=1 Tax=Anaerobacillus alkaliphilus TaxID=1548597 RepID=A0A4Q0VNN0_9BACI|nr:glycosyltransferase [Anaerobacillus alkaliphilus]
MISVITCTMRNTNMQNVFENYLSQMYKEKELIIVLNQDDMNIWEWKRKANKFPNVSVYQLPNWITLGECMNFAVKKAKFDYIAKFDDDDYYAPYYLTEAMEVFVKTDADIVGKRTVFVYMENTQSLMLRAKPHMENVRDATLVFKKKAWQVVPFRHLNKKSFWKFQNKARKKGFKFGITSRYNYTYIRRSPNEHTFNINDEDFLKKCTFLKKTQDYKKHVRNDPGPEES